MSSSQEFDATALAEKYIQGFSIARYMPFGIDSGHCDQVRFMLGCRVPLHRRTLRSREQ